MRRNIMIVLLHITGIIALNIFTRKEFVLQHYEQCKDHKNTPWTVHVLSQKYNRTHKAISGNVTIIDDYSDDYWLNLEIKRWGDGGWKNNAVSFERPKACSVSFLAFGDILKLVFDLKEKVCPIPKGTYVFKDLYLPGSNLPLLIKMGRQNIIFKVTTKSKEVVLCLDVIAEISEIV